MLKYFPNFNNFLFFVILFTDRRFYGKILVRKRISCLALRLRPQRSGLPYGNIRWHSRRYAYFSAFSPISLPPVPMSLQTNMVFGGNCMKDNRKVKVLHLIASLCLFFGSMIRLLHLCLNIPRWLHFCMLPLLLASIILYSIRLRIALKAKKEDRSTEECHTDH